MHRWIGWVGGVAILATTVGVKGEDFPVRPYVDPSQLEVPWPKHSHYKQPWRAFLETRSGHDFLAGIGINYNVPGQDDLAVRLLAETGFRTFRLEIGWGSVRWDEKALSNEKRFQHLLGLCKKYHIRPTMLLNAHQGVPCPTQFFSRRLTTAAPKGSRTVQLDRTEGIVVGRTGLSGLTNYWAAEALITGLDPATGLCQLSKPLPKDLKAGAEVSLATLKYLPLYPVGTREFEETAEGWIKYALLVARLVRQAGIDQFDVEIWNELTFGTKFLHVNNYHDPQIARFQKDFLNPGGHCWELARRTIQALKREHPGIRCIWGFSNTTFFHTPIEKLPPGTDGQSYHPYGTGTRKLPEQEYHRDRPGENLEGFTPTTNIRLPEGYAITFLQTESLMRLLNPKDRQRRPAGTERFHHFLTEHGVVPGEVGIEDVDRAWDYKARCALRSFCMYLSKGVTALHFFAAHERSPTGMGLLPADLVRLPVDVPFDKAATRPMKGLRNLTQPFQDSIPLQAPRQIQVEVTALGAQRKMFEEATQPPCLWHRDCFAFLPFQVHPNKFVIPMYVVTFDATKPMAEERFRIKILNLPSSLATRNGPSSTVRFYDSLENRDFPVKVLRMEDGAMEIEVEVVDSPRLLILGK